MKLDLYWSDEVFNIAEKTTGQKSFVRTYIGRCNITRFIDKNFDSTIEEEEAAGIYGRLSPSRNFTVVETVDEDEGYIPQGAKIAPKVVRFWGAGFEPEQYREFERRYKDITRDAGELDSTQQSIYKQIVMLETTIAKDLVYGKDTSKNVSVLNQLYGSAGIKNSSRKPEESDPEVDNTPFGVWIRRFENSKPIPETEPEFRDGNKIIKFICTWLFGHLCKIAGIRNSYFQLYEDEMTRLEVRKPEYQNVDDNVVLTEIFGDRPLDEEEFDADDFSYELSEVSEEEVSLE
jgi:hypothetical protein